MKKVFFALAVLAAIPALAPSPASAVERRFCIMRYDRDGSVPLECSFDTFAQCKATASGQTAQCSENPVFLAQSSQFRGQYRDQPDRRRYRQEY